ncbi:MAG: hypothetical protein J1D77_01070 [Muribaculaceae bacterium]|nr:hypothetical protein [Muribaculaceae bacterium]
MNTNEFMKRLREIVEEYIEGEDSYSDNVQLEINTTDWSMDIADPDNDLPNCDYYPLLDLVKMSVNEPGKWLPDEAAMESVAAEYVFTDD